MSDRIEEIRGRADKAAEMSGWLYDGYTGGTNLEVLAGLMATKDIPYLLAKLEAAEEMADVIESKYAVEGDLHDALRRYREAGESHE